MQLRQLLDSPAPLDLTTKQVAGLLLVGEGTLRNWRDGRVGKRGKPLLLPSKKVGRNYFYSSDTVCQFIAANPRLSDVYKELIS